jgi:inhibitor of cysteine peptidase
VVARSRVALLLLAFTIVAGVCAGAAAGTAQAAEGAVAISLEGKRLDTVGELLYGYTVVSLEDISASMGFTFEGFREGKAVVSYGDKRIAFNLSNNWAVVNGHEVLIPVAPVQESNRVMVPLRFLLENMGFMVRWIEGPPNSVDVRPVAENPIVIGTVRERQETSTLRIDMQYPKVVGLDPAVQGQMNAYFANRTGPAVEQGYESEKANVDAGWLERPTEVFLNYSVTYNQQNLLSMLFDDYLYTGGAHGMTGRHGYTIDIKTGVSYALKDLFQPGTDYVSLLSAEVRRQIDERGLTTIGIAPFTKIREDQDFYIYDGNLIVYFQQYELMAYAYGFPEFKIPMASLKSVLIPELAAREWAAAE